MTYSVAWFPQDYAYLFFIIKGVLALFSTLLLVLHMSQTWEHVISNGTLGQRMRYYTLLGFSILVTGGSAEQVADGSLVSYRHIGSMLVTVLLITAMVISIMEDQKRGTSSRLGNTSSD